MSGESHPEWVIDPETPSVARMYDYYLGGKDNYAADRAAADQVVAAMPNVLEFTRANRRLLSRAVTMMAGRGVLRFVPDEDRPAEVVAKLRAALAPGSYLAITHGYRGAITLDVENQVRSACGRTGGRADAEPFQSDMAPPGFLAGVGRVV
ncbi:SAM-dependent methyltransferase [Actinomadura chokoriensis]|uniref:SAM-dependent methyltransferase n=1 Tax=Actinomadura chokoriensis TaxID=454156 RepID=A0ABV4R3D6_9ACTN